MEHNPARRPLRVSSPTNAFEAMQTKHVLEHRKGKDSAEIAAVYTNRHTFTDQPTPAMPHRRTTACARREWNTTDVMKSSAASHFGRGPDPFRPGKRPFFAFTRDSLHDDTPT